MEARSISICHNNFSRFISHICISVLTLYLAIVPFISCKCEKSFYLYLLAITCYILYTKDKTGFQVFMTSSLFLSRLPCQRIQNWLTSKAPDTTPTDKLACLVCFYAIKTHHIFSFVYQGYIWHFMTSSDSTKM